MIVSVIIVADGIFVVYWYARDKILCSLKNTLACKDITGKTLDIL